MSSLTDAERRRVADYLADEAVAAAKFADILDDVGWDEYKVIVQLTAWAYDIVSRDLKHRFRQSIIEA